MPFIYIIQSGRDVLKIGKADNVRKRVRTLQTAQPFSLRVVHTIEVNDADCHALEQAIHKRLKRYRLQGEWFRVEPATAVKAADRCAELMHSSAARAAESEQALKDHPGTIRRNLYCPQCFHRGTTHVVHGAPIPSFKCSKCGAKPLISGTDRIRPWWEARRALKQ